MPLHTIHFVHTHSLAYNPVQSSPSKRREERAKGGRKRQNTGQRRSRNERSDVAPCIPPAKQEEGVQVDVDVEYRYRECRCVQSEKARERMTLISSASLLLLSSLDSRSVDQERERERGRRQPQHSRRVRHVARGEGAEADV